jgi:N-acetylneuraminate synthase
MADGLCSGMVMRIGNFTLGKPGHVFIIAEAGVNHNGRLDLAFKLVDAAKKAGADAVKFQNFQPEEVVTTKAPMAKYQKRNTGRNESQLDMIRKLALTPNEFKKISNYCVRRGIMFLSAPHSGFDSVDLLQKLRVPAFKFGSADLTNLPTLAYAAQFQKPIILSTGMATMTEISEAVQTIHNAGNTHLILLQCTTDYPTEKDEVNIRAMQAIAKRFKTIVGFSDHTRNSQAAIMAVTLGAQVIEKHLTLDKKMKGPDHAASADPKEFSQYVQEVRDVALILGTDTKAPTKSEKQFIPLVRKSLVARTAIKKGEKFSVENLAIKRPGTGLHPRIYFKLLGKKAKHTLLADEVLSRRDV